MTDEMIEDVKKLLNLLGVAWIVAPDGFEAEHLGAELSRKGIIDAVATGVSDAFAYGCTRLIRKKPGTSYEEMFEMEEMLETKTIKGQALTREQFVHACVVLGSDMSPGTRGIGPKSAFTRRGQSTKLTPRQEEAKKHFLTECPFAFTEIHHSQRNLPELVKWLVEEKNFNRESVEKQLEVFG